MKPSVQSKSEKAVSVDRTNWHDLADEDIDEIVGELNERLQARGLRTRFRIIVDDYGWDVVVYDGGDPEVVDTVEEAENIVGLLESQ